MGLQVPMAVAERIKTVHGGVHATGRDDREPIQLGGDSGDWERDRRTVSRTELIGIMRPRVEEILEEVRARLDLCGFDQLPSQSIVLTGGGSLIPGLAVRGAPSGRVVGLRGAGGPGQRPQPSAGREVVSGQLVSVRLLADAPPPQSRGMNKTVENVARVCFWRDVPKRHQ
jgi:cell division protein FtsA